MIPKVAALIMESGGWQAAYQAFAAVLILGEAMRNRRALDRANHLLQAERERSEQLLRNVLPGPIADRLKGNEAVIADRFPEVTVLFADLVDFTRRSRRSTFPTWEPKTPR